MTSQGDDKLGGLTERLKNLEERMEGLENASQEAAKLRAERDTLRQQFDMLFEESLDAILIVDSHSRTIIDANQAASRFLNYPFRGLRGIPFNSLYDPEWDGGDNPVDSQISHPDFQGAVAEYQQVYGRDGKKRVADMTAKMIDWHGQPAVLVTLRDSSERKRLEEMSRNLRKEAEAAARLKSVFLANVSHEIRTPLNGILGMADLLLGTNLDSEQREYAETTRQCGETLLALVNGVLELSRLEADKLELEQNEFNLRVCLEESLDIVAARAQGKGIDIGLGTAPDVPLYVVGDRARLQQVFLNLLGNAIKFTEEGEVELRVSTEERSGHSALLRFSVRDTGPGVPEEQQERIFERFEQAGSGSVQKVAGSGLGLSIARHLVEKMGGQIAVESRPGEGALFWFTAYLGVQLFADQPADSYESEALRRQCVVVLDEHELSRGLLVDELTQLGCMAFPAGSEEDASLVLREHEVSAVLVDAASVGENPYQLRERFAADATGQMPHLILMSTYGSSLNREEYEASGFRDQLLKPVRRSLLIDALLSRLHAPEGKQPAEPREADPASTSHRRRNAFRILLAEDDRASQVVARQVLTRNGFQCTVVDDGEEAVAAHEEKPFDLILMDCQMPRVDGYTATGTIRHLEGTVRRTPIVALTASVLEEDRQRCIDAGMDGYIRKPLQPKELTDTLDQYLLGEQQPADSAVLAAKPQKRPRAADPAATRLEPGGRAAQEIGLEDNWEEEEVFDSKILRAFEETAGRQDPALIHRLIQEFVKRFPAGLEQMREAVRREDWPRCRSLAQDYAGRGANAGARRVQLLCRAIDNAIKAQRPEIVPGLVDALEEAYHQTLPHLRRAYPEAFA